MDEARLLGIKNGEVLKPNFGTRGNTQHIDFIRKYSPHLRKKLLIYQAGIMLTVLTPMLAYFAIALLNSNAN